MKQPDYVGTLGPNQHGPDIPMDAKVLQRLPLSVLRRILPWEPYAFYIDIIEAQPQFSDAPQFKFSHQDYLGLHFISSSSDECDICDGDGYFTMGSHDYDCAECDGEGHLNEREDYRVVISVNGEIQWDECIGITKH